MILELICGISSIYSFFTIINKTKQPISIRINKEERIKICTEKFKYFISNIDESIDDESFRDAYLDFLRQEGISLIKLRIDNGFYDKLIEEQIKNKRLAVELNTFEIFQPLNEELRKDLKRYKREVNYEKYKTL